MFSHICLTRRCIIKQGYCFSAILPVILTRQMFSLSYIRHSEINTRPCFLIGFYIILHVTDFVRFRLMGHEAVH